MELNWRLNDGTTLQVYIPDSGQKGKINPQLFGIEVALQEFSSANNPSRLGWAP